MWLYLAAVLVGADPDQAVAKAVFDHMEQQVLKCKTLEVQLEVNSGTGKDASVAMKGRLLVAPGDKVRLVLDGSVMGKSTKITLVSDGTKQRMTSTDRPAQDQDTKKGFGKLALESMSRFGVMPGWFLIRAEDPGERDEFDTNKVFPISDLKLGKKEPVSGVECLAIEYQISPKGAKEPIPVTVWVDVKMNLPVKRVVAWKEGKDTITITETYTKAVVDGKLDDKEFELPK